MGPSNPCFPKHFPVVWLLVQSLKPQESGVRKLMEVLLKDKPGERKCMSGPTEPGRESKVMTLSPPLPPSSVHSQG